MRKTGLLMFLSFLGFSVQSQMIKEVSFEKQNSVFKLTYDLPEIASSYDVILTSNYPTGRGFVKVTENALGDVGEQISSGKNKTIYWQPKKGEDFNEAILEFKIVMIPLAFANDDNEAIVEKPKTALEEHWAEAERKAREKAEAEAERNEGRTFTGSDNRSGVGDPNPNPNVSDKVAESETNVYVKGRTVVKKPKAPTVNNDVNGIVIIKICVNNDGKVTIADFTQKGSTTTSNYAIKAAIANAKKWEFNKDMTVPDRQCGYIRYDFSTP